MNEKELWKAFQKTGKIEDYLKYSKAKKNK